MQYFLQEFRGGIIDFGASHSYYESDELLSEAKNILEPYKNVILLLPSSNVNESIQVLSERIKERYTPKERSSHVVESYILMNEKFIRHKSNYELAKYIIYTENKTIEAVAEEVLQKTKCKI